MGREVLVVVPHHASFIDQDIQILEGEFTVGTFVYRDPRDRFPLLRELRRSRLAVAWFVLGYAFAMVLMRPLTRARCLLIAGGWDVEALPEHEYGEMRWPKRRRRTAFALSHADRALAVSAYSLSRLHHVAPEAVASVLYHGFDPDKFAMGNGDRAGVVTVARVAPETWALKGLNTFLAAARRLPSIPFTMVGDTSRASALLEGRSPNVRVTGPLSQQELIGVYQRAEVYAQLSAVESFGCSLAEAMLCGCVPVVSDRGALPEVVGAVGEKVPYGDVTATVEAIDRTLGSDDGLRARDRVRTQFPLERRAAKLLGEARGLLGEAK